MTVGVTDLSSAAFGGKIDIPDGDGMTTNEKIQRALEDVRKNVDQPYVGVADWDRLIGILQTAFCDHKFVTKRTGGSPVDAGSNEMVRVCDLCGLEDDGD